MNTNTGLFIRFETIAARQLIGLSAKMSIKEDYTAALFSQFIKSMISQNTTIPGFIYDLRIFDPAMELHPEALFIKWAAVEKNSSNDYPSPFKDYSMPGGLYAIFLHKGPAMAAFQTFHYIFEKWLPESGLSIANRPHFDLLPKGYKPHDNNASHEIWIPVENTEH